MKVTIEEPGPKITEQDLARLESELSVRFPDDYRRFLLKTNGGIPVAGTFLFLNDPSREARVSWFYHAVPEIDYPEDDPLLEGCSILETAETRAGRLPLGFVAIAYEGGGDEICISCKPGSSYGKVYYWDHNFECDPEDDPEMTPETAGNTHLLADSFSEFLDGLY